MTHKLDVDDLVKRYTGGETAKSIAESLGVDVTAVTRRLERGQVPIRGFTEAIRLSISRRSPEALAEHRRRLNEGSRRANTGRTFSMETRMKRAASHQASLFRHRHDECA